MWVVEKGGGQSITGQNHITYGITEKRVKQWLMAVMNSKLGFENSEAHDKSELRM
jgi:hypothetical protein